MQCLKGFISGSTVKITPGNERCFISFIGFSKCLRNIFSQFKQARNLAR